MDGNDSNLSLLCRVRSRLYALPLAHVTETMRILPIEPLLGAPRFVLGVSIIRGKPLPVVDLGQLSNGQESTASRLVTIAVGARSVALAVDAVLGVQPIPAGSLQSLPPLLQDAAALSTIGTLDAELLLVLQSTRLLPEDFWAQQEAERLPA